MSCEDYKTPHTAQESAPAIDVAAPYDRLYRLAAMTVVIFLLATML